VPVTALVSRGAKAISPTFEMTKLTKPTSRAAGMAAGGEEHEHAHEHAQLCETVTIADGGAEPVAVMDAIMSSIEQAGPGASRGVLLGISADPSVEGYTLHQLDRRMFDLQTRALRLQQREEGAEWGSSGRLRLYTLDADACKQDVRDKLGIVAAQIEADGKELLGAVMFTCSGRTEGFFGEGAFDAKAFAARYVAASLIGMYAGGEIGPKAAADAPPSRATQVGDASLQGFTAVYGLFIVPKRTVTPLDLAFSDAGAVASAYAHMRLQPAAVASAAAAAKVAAAQAEKAAGRRSVAELAEALRSLTAGRLKRLMGRLGIEFVTGLEKSEYVEQIAKHEEADEALREDEA